MHGMLKELAEVRLTMLGLGHTYFLNNARRQAEYLGVFRGVLLISAIWYILYVYSKTCKKGPN